MENCPMDTGGGEERWRAYGESNMETYIIICKIDSQRETAVWLKQGLCDNLEGWDVEGYGREVQVVGVMGVSMFDRKQQNSVKQFSFN